MQHNHGRTSVYLEVLVLDEYQLQGSEESSVCSLAFCYTNTQQVGVTVAQEAAATKE